MDVSGGLGELRFTLEVKRVDTGKTETVEMFGFIDYEQLKEFVNECNTQHSGEKRSD